MRFIVEILPDPVAPLVIESFAKRHGWRSEELDGPVGAFANKVFVESLYGTIEGQRGDEAAESAREQAIQEVRQNVTIRIV